MQQAAFQVGRFVDRRIHGRQDLRLQPRLFVEADLQIGQQQQLGAGRVVGCLQRFAIMTERLPQIALASRWFTGEQAVKIGRYRCAGRGPIGEERQKAGKLEANFGKHLAVPLSHGPARPGRTPRPG